MVEYDSKNEYSRKAHTGKYFRDMRKVYTPLDARETLAARAVDEKEPKDSCFLHHSRAQPAHFIPLHATLARIAASLADLADKTKGISSILE